MSENRPVAPALPMYRPAVRPAGSLPGPAARSSRLGVVALALALGAVVAGTALSGVTAFAAASDAMARAIEVSPAGLEDLSDSQLLALLSPVRGLVLWAEIGWWAATALGVWALVQGIVAIATRRGRRPAIAAVVVAAVGPVVFGIAVATAVFSGIAVGAR